MRLIDAGKCPCNKCNKGCNKRHCDEFAIWLKGCDYDVNKIVENLERISKSNYEIYEAATKTNNTLLASRALAKGSAIKTIIEIVKDPEDKERTKRILDTHKEIINDLTQKG